MRNNQDLMEMPSEINWNELCKIEKAFEGGRLTELILIIENTPFNRWQPFSMVWHKKLKEWKCLENRAQVCIEVIKNSLKRIPYSKYCLEPSAKLNNLNKELIKILDQFFELANIFKNSRTAEIIKNAVLIEYMPANNFRDFTGYIMNNNFIRLKSGGNEYTTLFARDCTPDFESILNLTNRVLREIKERRDTLKRALNKAGISDFPQTWNEMTNLYKFERISDAIGLYNVQHQSTNESNE